MMEQFEGLTPETVLHLFLQARILRKSLLWSLSTVFRAATPPTWPRPPSCGASSSGTWRWSSCWL